MQIFYVNLFRIEALLDISANDYTFHRAILHTKVLKCCKIFSEVELFHESVFLRISVS